MYDELVKRLRELASIPEHCENVSFCEQCSKEDICLSFTNKRIIETATQAADVIEELNSQLDDFKRLCLPLKENRLYKYSDGRFVEVFLILPSEPPKEEAT